MERPYFEGINRSWKLLASTSPDPVKRLSPWQWSRKRLCRAGSHPIVDIWDDLAPKIAALNEENAFMSMNCFKIIHSSDESVLLERVVVVLLHLRPNMLSPAAGEVLAEKILAEYHKMYVKFLNREDPNRQIAWPIRILRESMLTKPSLPNPSTLPADIAVEIVEG